MSWWPWSRSGDSRAFNVLIYEEDYKHLCAWVLKKPNIETGGDLFGLWADKRTAVIQLVLGPGHGCTRTSVSFYQDVNYLQRVGWYLTQNEGVCHIGEWHSHHQLGLARPSGGDENTVWNNMPTYNLKRFVIFIANIQSYRQSYNVNVGCFLFEEDDKGNRLDVLPGEFTILQKENPFSGKVSVVKSKKKGAEKDENKIAPTDLQLEVKAGGKSPSVNYMKHLPPKKPKETPRSFEVVIYEEDYKELCAWVLKKPNIETGGDLFGLWSDKHTAVIQLVLGPGQGCRRTSTSFYQDIDYLQRVGSYLTQNEGVCHIGEWHSHHQMGLACPSGGDENTVWNNMPTYNLKRFVIFIANIRSSGQHDNVNVGCFLFETDDQGKRLAVLQGEFMILQKENPLPWKKEVLEKRSDGAEKDDENKITTKDLKLTGKKGKEWQPSVSYQKPPSPTPTKKRKGEKNTPAQTKDQDESKPGDEDSCGDSKKPKMDPKASSSTTDDTIHGSGNITPSGSLIDIDRLTIDDKQQDERPEVDPMDVDQNQEQPEKIKEEETSQHDPGENSVARSQNESFDQKSEKEKSQGEESKDDIPNAEVNKEANPPEGDQAKLMERDGAVERPQMKGPRPLPQPEQDMAPVGQTEQQTTEGEDKANPGGAPASQEPEKGSGGKESQQKEPRPLPELKEGTTSKDKTEQQTTEVVDKAKPGGAPESKLESGVKESQQKEPRPLPELKEETKSKKKTEQQTTKVEDEAKPGGAPASQEPEKESGGKESRQKEPRPLPELKEETTSKKKTEQQTLQAGEKPKPKPGQSKGGASQERRPLPQLKKETAVTGQTGRQKLQVGEKAKPKANPTKEGAVGGARPKPQPTQGKAPAQKPGKPLKIDVKAVKKPADQQTSRKKAGSTGRGSTRDKKK